ncbi:MAG: polymerase subunit sigma-24 [Frankiales bacterium]|nr:polymerase subunit sigma-24 [Frankiales bacterium]
MSRPDERTARFEHLYTLHRRDLLAYFLRRAAPADAADLLSECFVVAWRRIDVIPGGLNGRLWLFGVARNVLSNHQRAEQSSRHLAGELQLALSTAAETAASDVSVAVVVREALEALGDADREVMMLTVYEELTPTEIAEVTGRSRASVRVRLHRARRKLTRELDDLRVVRTDAPTPATLPA